MIQKVIINTKVGRMSLSDSQCLEQKKDHTISSRLNKQLSMEHQWRLHRIQSRPALRSKAHPQLWSVCRAFLQDLCNNLSLHGLPHIARQDRHFYERVLWGLLVFCAAIATSCTGYNSWVAYRHPSVTTTIATTRYDCANFPFPSLTICDTSRVDWQRALKLKHSDIPNGGNVTLEKILILLKALADMTFGDFDFMENLKVENLRSRDFENVDITELLRKVQRPCREVFHGPCWWRERFYNCCSLFEVQRTDLGFCYSFNSDLSETSQNYSRGYGRQGHPNYWLDWHGEVRPRRASTSGPWTGLRMTVEVMSPDQLPSGTNITPGVMFYLEGPRNFPNTENQHIDPASAVELSIHSVTLEAAERLRQVDYEDRRCLFLEERPGWNGVYKEHNCLAQCLREYVKTYCGCSPTFFFIEDNNTKYPPCDVRGLNCLRRYNLVFNSIIPSTSLEFFQSQQEGMQCDCPQDCNSHHYEFDTSISQTPNLSHIGFDVHIRSQYNMLYRTDAVYGAMEFLVAIGGIAGLFLGASLLSFMELLYFFTFRLFYHWKQARKTKPSRPPFVKFVLSSKY